VREEYEAYGGHLSSDSQFFAYLSNESGRRDIYVRTFDPSSGRFSANDQLWQVAEGRMLAAELTSCCQRADRQVRWREDAAELYYQDEDLGVMAVGVTVTTEFRAGTPRLLFQAPATGGLGNASFLSISGDGQRFVIAVPLPPERGVVTVAPEILATHTGTYAMRSGVDMAVTLEGDQLIIEGPNGENLPLSAESETLFFARMLDRDIEFEFLRDDNGITSGLRSSRPGGPGVKVIQ